jgi:hypothetical protein
MAADTRHPPTVAVAAMLRRAVLGAEASTAVVAVAVLMEAVEAVPTAEAAEGRTAVVVAARMAAVVAGTTKL